MAYGLRIKNAAGTVMLDTTETLGRVVFAEVIPSGDSDSASVPGVSGKTYHILSMPLEAFKLAPSASISGTTLSWVAQEVVDPPVVMRSCESLLIVLLSD